MKLTNKLELRLEDFDKCHTLVDTDCPLGRLYDYSCALKHFVIEKMKEVEEKLDKSSKEEKAENV